MHLEKIRLEQIQNGRLSAIIGRFHAQSEKKLDFEDSLTILYYGLIWYKTTLTNMVATFF